MEHRDRAVNGGKLSSPVRSVTGITFSFPLINIKTKIINKYPILKILFFCIKLIGFLLLVWTHSTFLPTDRYSARDIELVACRDGAPNRTGIAQGI